MTIDSMRVGGGRCPFLIVGGLLLVSVMLLCNWWTLTAENTELLHQIDELSEQLKFSVDERDKCVTQLGQTQLDLKRSREDGASLRLQLDQHLEVTNRNKKLDYSLAMCKGELESLQKLEVSRTNTMDSLKQEKNAINKQLEAKRSDNERLQEELNKLKQEMEKMKSTLNAPVEKKATNLQNLPTNPKLEDNAGDQVDPYHQAGIKPVDDPNNAAEILTK